MQRWLTSNQILDHVHVRKGTDGGDLVVLGDLRQAGQTVLAIDVHGARTADTLTARSTDYDPTTSATV